MNINEKICELMKRHGLSQHALAELVDVSQNSVSGWCKTAKPRPKQLNRLSEVLNVSTDCLLDDHIDLPEWIPPLKAAGPTLSSSDLKGLKTRIDALGIALNDISKFVGDLAEKIDQK